MDKLQARAALETAQGAAAHLDGPDGNVWLDKLDGDFEVLEAALGWYVENDPDQGLVMAAALHIFWMERSHLSSGRQWLKRLLDIPETREAGRDRGAALKAAGRIAFRAGG